jgi:hypothetical protein
MSFSGSTRESAKTLTLVELGNDGTVFFLWSVFFGLTVSGPSETARLHAIFLTSSTKDDASFVYKGSVKFSQENSWVKIAWIQFLPAFQGSALAPTRLRRFGCATLPIGARPCSATSFHHPQPFSRLQTFLGAV